MSDEIILYELAAADDTRFSPSCWRTHFGLGHKGLSFKSVRIRFPDIGGLGGPRRTVPVIRIGGTFVEDSWDIAEFLDERFPDRPPLLGCALGRGTSRFVECFTDKVIHPTMLRLVSRDVFDRMDPHDQRYFRRTREGMLRCTLEEAQATRDQTVPARRKAIHPIRLTLNKQPWLSGEQRAMPTTSCSRPSSGGGSPPTSRSWRTRIPLRGGSSAALTCTTASAARFIPTGGPGFAGIGVWDPATTADFPALA